MAYVSVQDHAVDKKFISRLDDSLEKQGLLLGVDYSWSYHSTWGTTKTARAMIRELQNSKPDLLVVTTKTPVIEAVASGMPTVFAYYGNLIEDGIASSIAQPGINATGVSMYSPMHAKRIEILATLIPNAKRIGVLIDETESSRPQLLSQLANLPSIHMEKVSLIHINAGNIKRLKDVVKAKKIDCIYVPLHGIFYKNRESIVSTINSLMLPSMYEIAEFVDVGGLASYQPKLNWRFNRMASLIVHISRGVPPSTLPIEVPNEFELRFNTKTSSLIGLSPSKRSLDRFTVFVQSP